MSKVVDLAKERAKRKLIKDLQDLRRKYMDGTIHHGEYIKLSDMVRDIYRQEINK